MYEHYFGIGTHIALMIAEDVLPPAKLSQSVLWRWLGRGQKYLWSKKNGEEAEQEEQGNWKKETSLLITPKFTMQSTENILALLSK